METRHNLEHTTERLTEGLRCPWKWGHWHSISSFQGKNGEKKTREKTEEAGSASVYPYGSVLGYELVTSQPSRPITVVWPEYRTWFIGPCLGTATNIVYR